MYLRAIHDEGLRVPQDISVVAFDNTYLSGALTPALTSVGANYTEFAKHLVEAAIRASENETCLEDYMAPTDVNAGVNAPDRYVLSNATTEIPAHMCLKKIFEEYESGFIRPKEDRK